MKKYNINGRTITVRKGGITHKFIESNYGVPFAVIGTVLAGIAGVYCLAIMWAGILG